MTTETDYMGIVHWKSERFNKEGEFQSNAVFYEDDDPRIELIIDRYGDEIWIVGYTEAIPLLRGEIPRRWLGIRVRDNCLMGFI